MEKEIENYLNQNYLLIRKDRLYHFLGGTVVTIIALLGFTYLSGTQAVKHAISDQAVSKAMNEILKIEEESKTHFEDFKRYFNQIKDKKLYFTGTKKDGQTISVPSGSKTDQWDVILIPKEIGENESGSNGDNALLQYKASAEPNSDKSGWNVNVYCLYRRSNSENQIKRLSCDVTYIIFPRAFRLGK